MILDAGLIALRKDKLPNPNGVIALWPIQRKPIRLIPDFDIDCFFFEVTLNIEAESLFIILNGVEDFPLTLVNRAENQFRYKSSNIGARGFLGFNLGYYELEVYFESYRQRLTSLINKVDNLPNKHLSYMYDSVVDSRFFNLYIQKYSRANSPAGSGFSDHQNSHFWLKIFTARKVLEVVRGFFTGKLEFFNRIAKESKVSSYTNFSEVDSNDIRWVMENPEQLYPCSSSEGVLTYQGRRYSISNISQTTRVIDFDTYETRFIISTLYSIKCELMSLLSENKNVDLFPKNRIGILVEQISFCIESALEVTNLLPPFDQTPEYSNKYYDDYRHGELFELLFQWYFINDLSSGNSLLAPVSSITDVFEHYCLIKIIESFEIEGFLLLAQHPKSDDETDYVTLEKGKDWITIYYEPIITRRSIGPLRLSKSKSNHQKPDYVIDCMISGKSCCGVIDAKFSTKAFVERQLGPEIWSKYGLYLHNSDWGPIDFVLAVYPEVIPDKFFSSDARHDECSPSIKPFLGVFSIPMSNNSASTISKYLMDILVNS